MKKILTFILTAMLTIGACIGFTACGKQLTGFDIELAKKTVDYLNEKYGTNVEVEFQEIDWDSKETLLENGTIDLVWNGMTITEERAENMTISVPYLKNKQVAVVRKADLETLGNKNEEEMVYGAESGSAGEDVIKEFPENIEKVYAPTQLDALTQLDNGTIDVAIIDSVMAGYYTTNGAYKDKLVVVEGVVYAEEEYGIAAKKGNEALISKINEALIALRETGYTEVATAYGLNASCSITAETVDNYASATDNSWARVVESGKLVIGYTVFAPIAFKK